MPQMRQRYQTLSVQVALRLLAGIENRTWGSWLPGERALTKSLQTSRKTLRKALAQLERDGAIRTRQGCGREIVATRRTSERPAAQEESVGLLAPESLENLRPYTALWVDELRALLFENQVRLVTFSGHRYFSGHPENALARLLEQNPQRCWVLAHSNEAIQHWFHDRRIPCLIAGSSHPGLPLPSVDLDYFALCRHAAGVMLRLGHRRLAFFAPQSKRAGDLESERGFLSGARSSRHANVESVIAHHDGTVDGAYRALRRLFAMVARPTSVLVTNPAYYLTAFAFLAERGLRVPQDVSLLSRDDDSFLSYIRPTPARYSCNPKAYARRLQSQLQLCFAGEVGAHSIQRIEAKFLAGDSLGPAP